MIQDAIEQVEGQDDGDQSEDVAGDILEAVHEVEAAVLDHELGHVPDTLLCRFSDLGVLGDEVPGQHQAENLVPCQG